MKFWENIEWQEKIIKVQPEFLEIIKNGTDIEIEWSTFTLIIDGDNHPLEIVIFDERYKIIKKK